MKTLADIPRNFTLEYQKIFVESHTRKKPTIELLAVCVDMYLRDSILEPNREFCIKSLQSRINAGDIFLIAYKEDEVCGMLLADIRQSELNGERTCVQTYCDTKLSNTMERINCVVALHRLLCDICDDRKIPLIMSGSCHLDDTNSIARILEKEGWLRHNHLAFRRIE
jgi:hypothetical protein